MLKTGNSVLDHLESKAVGLFSQLGAASLAAQSVPQIKAGFSEARRAFDADIHRYRLDGRKCSDTAEHAVGLARQIAAAVPAKALCLRLMNMEHSMESARVAAVRSAPGHKAEAAWTELEKDLSQQASEAYEKFVNLHAAELTAPQEAWSGQQQKRPMAQQVEGAQYKRSANEQYQFEGAQICRKWTSDPAAGHACFRGEGCRFAPCNPRVVAQAGGEPFRARLHSWRQTRGGSATAAPGQL